MDAITMLKQDHKAVEALFKRFDKATQKGGEDRRALVDEMIKELAAHAAIEEQVFYPSVRSEVDSTNDVVLESLEEHHVVKWTLSELDGMPEEHDRFTAKVTVLMESVRHHVKEEESELFPKVREALGRKRLAEMGELMGQAKKVAPTKPHPRQPDEPPGNLVVGLPVAATDRARSAARTVTRRATRMVTGRR